MIDYQTFQQIRLLHDQQKLNAAQIARSLGLHWQTVQKWIGRPRYEARASAPPTRRDSKLAAFKGTIVRLLESHPFTAAQLLSRLRAEGYQGGYSILKDFVRAVRPKHAPAFLTLHFAPGQCAHHAERKDENWVFQIATREAMVTAFVHKNEVVAKNRRRCGGLKLSGIGFVHEEKPCGQV
jgi:hypothetical protein